MVKTCQFSNLHAEYRERRYRNCYGWSRFEHGLTDDMPRWKSLKLDLSTWGQPSWIYYTVKWNLFFTQHLSRFCNILFSNNQSTLDRWNRFYFSLQLKFATPWPWHALRNSYHPPVHDLFVIRETILSSNMIVNVENMGSG